MKAVRKPLFLRSGCEITASFVVTTIYPVESVVELLKMNICWNITWCYMLLFNLFCLQCVKKIFGAPKILNNFGAIKFLFSNIAIAILNFFLYPLYKVVDILDNRCFIFIPVLRLFSWLLSVHFQLSLFFPSQRRLRQLYGKL